MATNDLTPAPGEITALLGRGAEFRGKLVFDGRARLDGRFVGEVHSEGVLVVGEHAELEGTFDVGSLLVLGGVVRGTVRAREVIELHADAHVLAELETPRLFVDKGARFDGSCRMSDGAPSERLPLEDVRAADVAVEVSSRVDVAVETSSTERDVAKREALEHPADADVARDAEDGAEHTGAKDTGAKDTGAKDTGADDTGADATDEAR